LLLGRAVVSLSTLLRLLELANGGIQSIEASIGVLKLSEGLATSALGITTADTLLIELIAEVIVVALKLALSLLEDLTSGDLTIEGLLEVGNGGLVGNLEVVELTIAFALLFELVLEVFNLSLEVSNELIGA